MSKNQSLKKMLATVGKVFNVTKIADQPVTSSYLQKYYRVNRLGYWFFHSRAGFVHMGISNGGVFNEADFEAQARLVSDYIVSRKAKNVLELAMGKGANFRYLTTAHPKVHFDGIDLPNGQLKARRFASTQNGRVRYGTFHDLSVYAENSMDIVFIVEAWGYSDDKDLLLQQIHRVLKPGGLFIAFDGFNAKLIKDYTPDELLTMKLLWKGMAGDITNFKHEDAETLVAKSGFRILRVDDLSKEILPCLKRLELTAARFFRHPNIARIVIKILPMAFTANVISGYLMPYAVEHKLAEYKLIIGEKPHN